MLDSFLAFIQVLVGAWVVVSWVGVERVQGFGADYKGRPCIQVVCVYPGPWAHSY